MGTCQGRGSQSLWPVPPGWRDTSNGLGWWAGSGVRASQRKGTVRRDCSGINSLRET